MINRLFSKIKSYYVTFLSLWTYQTKTFYKKKINEKVFSSICIFINFNEFLLFVYVSRKGSIQIDEQE